MLRLALLLIRVLAPLVPSARRRTWVAQWRGELWHYDAWLRRESADAGTRRRCVNALKLLARSLGAVSHALTLRAIAASGTEPLRMILNDLSFAWRLFVRRPAFTATAVLIVALGIGANATIFSWIEAVLLEPLSGVPAQERLVSVRGTFGSRNNLSTSYPNFVDLKSASIDGLEDITAFRVLAMTVRTGGDPLRAFGELVSPNFFDVLHVQPSLGRTFRPEEGATPGKEAVAVVSHAFWTRVLNADPAAIGRTLTVNGTMFTVIGVTPAEFHGSVAGLALDIFVPVTMQKAVMGGNRLSERGNSWLQVYGRLAAGATLDKAQAGLRVAAARLAAADPANKGRGLSAVPLSKDGASGMMLPVMSTLMAVVATLLLIACANLAGLLLARAAGRQREVAVRVAVGASRARVVRQFLIENLVITTAGGIGGLIIASWTSRMLTLFIPKTPFPVAFRPGLSLTVVTFAAGATVLTAIVSGLLPALRGSRPDVAIALKQSAPSAIGGRARVRQALVVVQVALSMLLLVCASLFLRSLWYARSMDPGYSVRQGLFASIDLQAAGFDEVSGRAAVEQLIQRLSTVPGVEHASLATTLPLDLGGGSDMSVTVDGYVPAPNEEMTTYYNRVGPWYFETMGIGLVEGRGIDMHERAGRPLGIVINETMARRYFAGRSAIGGTIRFGLGPATVIGVARDGKYGSLAEVPRNYMYVPMLQFYRPDAVLLVRTAGEPGAMLPQIQSEVRRMSANLPLFDVRTVEEHRQLSLFVPRMASTLLGLFGGLALVLALVGLYGVIAYTTAERTREIGVRIALGARRGEIAGLIFSQGAALAGAGIAVGLVLATLVARLFASQLVGIGALDPISYAAMAVLLLVVAAAACAIPARRATMLDPLSALRMD